MASIANIIKDGRGSAGSGGAWLVEQDQDIYSLWHYDTLMLRWNTKNPRDPEVLTYSTGWGSVSDQNGMNTAFKILGLPLRFDRDQRGGGPRITDISDTVDESTIKAVQELYS